MIQCLSIVMPCFNEQEAIPEVIPRTIESLNALKQQNRIADFELIVVNDNSTDDSKKHLQKFSQVQLLNRSENTRGYGAALKAGFAAAKGDWLGFLDVDNTYFPEDLSLFVDEIDSGGVDFVMGQRPFSEKGMSVTRGLGNWFYVVLARLLYRSQLDDVCSGFRCFHRRRLEDVLSTQEQGLNFSIELTLQTISQKIPMKTIPIRYDHRVGESKLSVASDGWAFLKVLMTSKLRQSNAFKHSRV